MAGQATKEEAKEVRVISAILAVADREGYGEVLQGFFKALHQLATGVKSPSTSTICKICNEGVEHYLGDPIVTLDDFGEYLQAGGVLRAIRLAREEGLLLGKVEQIIRKEREKGWMEQRRRNPFVDVPPQTTDDIPTLERAVAKVPIYICTYCGAISLGGAAGIQVQKEK